MWNDPLVVSYVFHIDADFGEELSYVTCSPESGQVLVTTWDGRLFCRLGIAGIDPVGNSWAELSRPEGFRLVVAAIGEKSVWAVTVDGRVIMLCSVKSVRQPSGPFHFNFCFRLNVLWMAGGLSTRFYCRVTASNSGL